MEAASVPGSIRRRISRIQADHHSGSVALTREAGEVLTALASLQRLSSADFERMLATTCRLLVCAQPAMAPILNLSNAALLAGGRPSRVKSAVARFLKGMDAAGQIVSASASSLLADGMTVMTHSSSETVRKALLQASASGRRLRVIATESRPLREGVALAKALGQAGIPVTLIADAAMACLLDEADLVLVGADALTGRWLINKAGTSLAALGAKKLKKPFYALAGSEKFIPESYRLPQEIPKDAEELLEQPLPNVTVRNLYFDWTPLTWLTGIVTELGILRPPKLRPLLRHLRLHPVVAERGSTL